MFLFNKGEKIGDFYVEEQIKEGSYYETYEVNEGVQGITYFLKLIRLDELKPSRFDRNGRLIEAEIEESHDYKGRYAYYGSDTLEKDGRRLLYMVMEKASEYRLSYMLHTEECMTADELMRFMELLLTILRELHSASRPIIHNAVTPENIRWEYSYSYMEDIDSYVRDYSRMQLTGFGRARYRDLPPDPESWHGQNLYYVAPERLTGGGSDTSDIFSAGVIMYQLVFGTMPWEAYIDSLPLKDQVLAIIEKRKSRLVLPEVRLIDVDDDMLKPMLWALEPSPAMRCSISADCFLDDLRRSYREFKERRERIRRETPPDPPGKSCDTPGEDAGAVNDGADDGPDADSAAGSAAPGGDDAAAGGEQAVSAPGITLRKGNGFAGVAGMEDIKAMMRKKIINVLRKPELAGKYRIQIPNGMLLYGPPGCGKSFIARKFAEEAGWNYRFVRASDLASTYIHGTQEKIGQLFDEARKNAPMILNFDEFDAMVPDRGRIDNPNLSGEVNEFLSQMNSCGKDRVFVIASTNRPDLIDPAVRRKGRLDLLIYIPVPDLEAREKMFMVQMSGRPREEGIDFRRLASLTENYVAADIACIVNDAAEQAFDEEEDITERMLEDAIGRTRPSVGPDDIRYYEDLRKKIEKSAKESAHSPIGFIRE